MNISYRKEEKNKLELNRLYRWLTYIPSEWDIETVLEKKAKDLTPCELERLEQINYDMELASLIKKDIFNDFTTQNILSIDLNNIMEKKLSKTVINYCKNQIEEYSSLSNDDLSSIIDKYQDEERSLVNDYICYNLENIYLDRAVTNVNNTPIKENIKKLNII